MGSRVRAQRICAGGSAGNLQPDGVQQLLHLEGFWSVRRAPSMRATSKKFKMPIVAALVMAMIFVFWKFAT